MKFNQSLSSAPTQERETRTRREYAFENQSSRILSQILECLQKKNKNKNKTILCDWIMILILIGSDDKHGRVFGKHAPSSSSFIPVSWDLNKRSALKAIENVEDGCMAAPETETNPIGQSIESKWVEFTYGRHVSLDILGQRIAEPVGMSLATGGERAL